jgi:P4 family phage/plasmid primase-like protien
MATTPFAAAAMNYLEAGWSPIPLPHKEKWPPPDHPHSFTGAAGQYVDEAQLREWLRPRARVRSGNLSYPPANVALRLPRNVLGVDVDAYGTKAGLVTLARAEEEWGALPATWVATSRTDGVSGIRLYRVPAGLAWPGELPTGKGVELIRWDHRFAIVAPSIHPEGREYSWWLEELRLDEAGEEERVFLAQPDTIPLIDDLPELPETWVEGLTGGTKWQERSADESMGATEVRDWLAARPSPEKPCAAMRSTLSKYQRDVRHAGDDGGAHEAALHGAWALIGDAGAGHKGIHSALNKLRKAFLVAVAERRGSGRDGDRLAKEEWARIVVRGVQKVSAEGEPETEDPCESLMAPTKKAKGGSDAIVWRLDEVGNAERFVRVADNRARWVPAFDGWAIWNGSHWELDADKQVDRWVVKAINSINRDAEFLKGDGDEKLVKAFKAHYKSSSTNGKMRGTLEVAKGRKGILVPGEKFDANGKILVCGGGQTIELGKLGIKVRPSWQDDYSTISAGTEYNPKARNELWDDFLGRFQPDPEVRLWIQKLVGYSLLGTNPKRLFVVCWGPTSTGKTTFAESIRQALGGYAKTVNLSIFRDNQDERARPDLAEALPKRIVFAEEVSSAWHLHPDQIKRITGGAPINARRPFAKKYLEQIPAFTPWLLMNGVPTIDGADKALYRRLVVIPWITQIPQSEEDADARDQMISEGREAILAWAVEGYRLWKSGADDLSEPPLSAVEKHLEFRSEMSDVDRFIAESCDEGLEYAILPSELYEAYRIWCERNGVKPNDRISGTKFGREIGGKGYDKKQIRVGEDKYPTWHRIGLRLNKDWSRIVG